VNNRTSEITFLLEKFHPHGANDQNPRYEVSEMTLDELDSNLGRKTMVSALRFESRHVVKAIEERKEPDGKITKVEIQEKETFYLVIFDGQLKLKTTIFPLKDITPFYWKETELAKQKENPEKDQMLENFSRMLNEDTTGA
jgi:hypothetical protein